MYNIMSCVWSLNYENRPDVSSQPVKIVVCGKFLCILKMGILWNHYETWCHELRPCCDTKIRYMYHHCYCFVGYIVAAVRTNAVRCRTTNWRIWGSKVTVKQPPFCQVSFELNAVMCFECSVQMWMLCTKPPFVSFLFYLYTHLYRYYLM